MPVCHAGNREQIVFSDGVDVLSQFDIVWAAENGNRRDVEVDELKSARLQFRIVQ
jgi:hypothetical protein